MYGKSIYQCKHIDMTGLKMRFGASVHWKMMVKMIR